MKEIVMYYDNLAKAFLNSGFKVGFKKLLYSKHASHDSSCVASYWFKGTKIFLVKTTGNVVTSIKDAWIESEVRITDTNYAEAFERLKQAMANTYAETPSIMIVFKGVLFEEFDTETTRRTNVVKNAPFFNPEFAAIFKDELQAESKEPTIRPKLYQMFRDKLGRLGYISNILGDEVVFRDVYSSVSVIEQTDFLNIAENYTPEVIPFDLTDALNKCLQYLHEVINPSELADTLELLGYENLDRLRTIKAEIPSAKYDELPATNGTLMFHVGNFVFSVDTMFDLGTCKLCHATSVLDDGCFTEKSIRGLVLPYDFKEFAENLLSSLLTNFDFLLNEMPYARKQLYAMITALSLIPEHEVPKVRVWERFTNNDFDPSDYMKRTYNIDVNLLPAASLAACKTRSECDALYDSVKDILTK